MSKTIGKIVGGTITGGITDAGKATSDLLSGTGQALGLSSGGGTQTVTTTPNVPQYVADYQNQMFNLARGTAAGIGSRQFADFSGLQNQGFNALSGINQNAGMQGAQNALGQLQGMQFTPGSFLQGDIGAYQNPYTQQVIDTTMADIDRARQLQQQQVNAQALSRGAFGGSRQAVAEAENNRNFLDQQARTSAGLRQQGFDTAAGLMQSDMARNLQAQQLRAGALSNALSGGLQFNNSFLGNVNAQLQGGAMQQDLQQQRMDAIRNLPLERLGILSSTFTGGQLPYGQSQTSPVQKSNPFLGALGGAATGAGIGAAIGGTGLFGLSAGATGAGLGALAAFL